MKALLFFLAILAIVFGVFWYLNRGVAFEPDNPYCKEIRAKIETSEYDISYGERVKMVWHGCF